MAEDPKKVYFVENDTRARETTKEKKKTARRVPENGDEKEIQQVRCSNRK